LVWVRRKDPNRDYAENESREAFEDETSGEERGGQRSKTKGRRGKKEAKNDGNGGDGLTSSANLGNLPRRP
jgi:hypothetical protein